MFKLFFTDEQNQIWSSRNIRFDTYIVYKQSIDHRYTPKTFHHRNVWNIRSKFCLEWSRTYDVLLLKLAGICQEIRKRKKYLESLHSKGQRRVWSFEIHPCYFLSSIGHHSFPFYSVYDAVTPRILSFLFIYHRWTFITRFYNDDIDYAELLEGLSLIVASKK
jgi:hypothetical protein